ncbi:unknown [Mycoplasma sp. CAG:956]|nr:unknown [Mycoplasma sp. CAG:956]
MAYQCDYVIDNNFTKIKIPLSKLDGNRKEITEICLTTFTKDNKCHTNSISLKDLKLIIK